MDADGAPLDRDAPAPPRRERLYAAALDQETCNACAAFAGLDYAADDVDAPVIPNPACTHPTGCRCTWL